MSAVDYASVASNAALFATILTPLLTYINRDSQTYFFDLLGVPFTIFLITALISAISPGDLAIVLFAIGVIIEIVIYAMMTIEQYYFAKLKIT